MNNGNTSAEIFLDGGKRRKYNKGCGTSAYHTAYPVAAAHVARGRTWEKAVSADQSQYPSDRGRNASAAQSTGDRAAGG